jgi:hypothetical protein
MIKLYTIYKTTNLVNEKYYFGVHKTGNPYDDYLGSGTYVRRAIKKYGPEKFRKDVLFIYRDAESAFGKEDELIQCYRGLDPRCMNIMNGGWGGFDYVNENGLSGCIEGGKKANKILREKMKTDPILTAKMAAALLINHAQWLGSDAGKESTRRSQLKAVEAWRGCSHSKIVKQMQSERMRGNNLRKDKSCYADGAMCGISYGICGQCSRVFVKLKFRRVFCSRKCSGKRGYFKIDWPCFEALQEMIALSSKVKVAAALGVSEGAVRARLKNLALIV